jgi:hypothetical protein
MPGEKKMRLTSGEGMAALIKRIFKDPSDHVFSMRRGGYYGHAPGCSAFGQYFAFTLISAEIR